VIRPEPYGSQALIKLSWENLAGNHPPTGLR
jgi:hypothetical protein